MDKKPHNAQRKQIAHSIINKTYFKKRKKTNSTIAEVRPSSSVITLNVNGLKSWIKEHDLTQ